MYRMYAADLQARINLGIRRRLAPLMENDPDRIKLMNSLLLSMPGSPIVYYGDEIGMGDNIYLGDRNGVRTPMQWSPDRNAGFSRADPQRLYLPPIMDPVYGFEAVNVEAQTRDPSVAAQLDEAHARHAQDEPGVRPRPARVPAARQPEGAGLPEASYGDEAILCVANLARTAQPVELDLKRFKGRVPVEMLGRTAVPADRRAASTCSRCPRTASTGSASRPTPPPPDWHTRDDGRRGAPDAGAVRRLDELLPRPGRAPLAHRHGGEAARAAREPRCCRGSSRRSAGTRRRASRSRRAVLRDHAIWSVGADQLAPALLSKSKDSLYFLPLALAWEEEEEQ